MSPDGQIVAVADGHEVLTYRTSNEAPVWIYVCDAPVRGLDAAAPDIVVLDAAGNVIGLNPEDGKPRWQMGPFGPDGLLGTSLSGRWAVVTGNTLIVGRSGQKIQEITLEDPEVVSVAFGGMVPAVGYRDGRIRFYPEGDPVQRQGAEPLGMLTSGRDGVVVACGPHLAEMPAEGKATTFVTYDGETLTGAIRSTNGRLIAARVGEQYVAAFAEGGAVTLGHLRYFERKAGDGAFDADGNLWVACGQGHANRLDFHKGLIARTDEHPDHARGTWQVQFKTDQAPDPDALKPDPDVRIEEEEAPPSLLVRIEKIFFGVVVVIGTWWLLMRLLG